MRINNIEKLLSGTENFFSDKQEFLFDELARPAAEKNPTSKLDIGVYHRVLYYESIRISSEGGAGDSGTSVRLQKKKRTSGREEAGKYYMYVNKVEICGINTSKLPIMKDVEMEDMIERIRSGDTALRDEFITGNLRLVLSVIQKFQNRGENMDDLFQVGCIGLIKALDNFDTSHQVKFSTYAVPMNVRR